MKEDAFQTDFLIWFLEKADQAFNESEPQLHTMASEFLVRFFESIGKQVHGFGSVKTEAGYESNLIKIEIDDKHVVLMQNLTAGQPSNEALTKEVNREKMQGEIESGQLFPVFLKTKYEFTVNESDLIYPILYRKVLLDCLFGPVSRGIESERIMRYRDWLLEVEEEFSGFRNKVSSTWGYKEWIGYSNLMEQEMNWGRYGYSPDEEGGRFDFLVNNN